MDVSYFGAEYSRSNYWVIEDHVYDGFIKLLIRAWASFPALGDVR